MLLDLEGGSRLVIWDWKSAQVLFVCQFLDHDLSMTLKHPSRTLKWRVTFLWSSSTMTGY